MAENPDVSTQEPHESDEALKKRLLSRIAVAGVLIVALLGGLAVVDALFGPPQPKTPPEEVVVAKQEEAQPETKPEEKTETPAAEKPAELVQEEKKEEPKPEVAAEPERTTSVVAPQAKPLRPLTLPATPRRANVRSSAPA